MHDVVAMICGSRGLFPYSYWGWQATLAVFYAMREITSSKHDDGNARIIKGK